MNTKTNINLCLEMLGVKEYSKVHRIFVGKTFIKIYLECPGMLIGRAGETINKFKEMLKTEKEIHLIEYNPFK